LNDLRRFLCFKKFLPEVFNRTGEKMKPIDGVNTVFISLFMWLGFPILGVHSQQLIENAVLDKKVNAFLTGHRGQWVDMNVPVSDGRLLYDIIIKNGYKSAVEIGTSTGHSAIWIAWALSKTGGKLVTIEIDESRYLEALENFKLAGLSELIDARLADAHQLVAKLKGPFDFVFSDADKDWYINYFKSLSPKLVPGGCFASHNIQDNRHSWYGRRGFSQDYLNYVKNLPNYETAVDNSGAGLAISYKILD